VHRLRDAKRKYSQAASQNRTNPLIVFKLGDKYPQQRAPTAPPSALFPAGSSSGSAESSPPFPPAVAAAVSVASLDDFELWPAAGGECVADAAPPPLSLSLHGIAISACVSVESGVSSGGVSSEVESVDRCVAFSMRCR
jgi:hypothetical protein